MSDGGGTELAKAYVQIVPSMKGMEGSIGGLLDGESIGQKLVGGIKKVIAVAGIGKVLSTALTEGAALEQSIGGIETLFKKNADKVKANAAEAYRTAGMSANEYMELTTSFAASLLQSTAGNTSKAADVADTAMQDMSDNANKMGTNMEDIKNAYQGFAKQNYTMLDNLKLGYGGTKTEMQRLLQDAQKVTGVKYDINSLSDVYSAIHVIQGELGITGTTAKEAATTLSGSANAMKASFKNVMGQLALGQDVTPALQALAQTTTTFLVGNLFPAIINVFSALPMALITLIQSFVPQFATAFTGLIAQMSSGISTAAPQFFVQANSLVTQFLTMVQTELPGFLQSGISMISNLASGIVQSLPTLLPMAATVIVRFMSGLLSAAGQIISAGVTLIGKLATGIINNLPKIAAAAAKTISIFLNGFGQNLPKMLQSGIELIGKIAAGIIRGIPKLVSQIPKVVSSVKRAFSNTNWAEIGRNILKGIANGIRNAGSMIWNAIKPILSGFKDKVLAHFGIHSPSKWGVWVGKMIDLGLAQGVENYANPLSDAIETIKGTIANPLQSKLSYATSGKVTLSKASDAEADGQRDLLLKLLEVLTDNRKKEIVLKIKDREVARALVDMGVVFE